MAVVVQCFHCNAILELDEAFRGGVCRCSECGSLLQVPKSEGPKAAKKARPATPGAALRRGGEAAGLRGTGLGGGSSGQFNPGQCGGAEGCLRGRVGGGYLSEN